jgi:hypothetical protein
MAEVLTLIFEFQGLEPPDALNAITRVLVKNEIPFHDVRLYGKPVPFSRIATILERDKRDTFFVTAEGFEMHLTSVRNYHFNSLSIKSEQPIGVNWDKWLFELLNEHFVLAWVADVEYDFWQNAVDPLQFRAHGRAWEHLPKISNGLPPPLEQTVVDTSQNPGRRTLRRGFIEAVGSRMWLGERFWGLTGAEKQRVMSAPFLKSTKIAPGIVRIESSISCFTTDQGTIGKLQRELRELLFPLAAQ